MKLLLIDNYDSFTFNLVQRIWELDPAIPIEVVRNDEIDAAGAEAIAPTHLLLSPGPCTPAEAGVCRDLIPHFRGRIPILGVCLGHQAIAAAFGGPVERGEPRHGKTSPIHHHGTGLFRGIPSPFPACRYHSLMVDAVPAGLERDAWTDDGIVMALRHRDHPVFGVQFHPESFRTEHGLELLRNFTECAA